MTTQKKKAKSASRKKDQVQKSLNAAARILNRPVHKPTLNVAAGVSPNTFAAMSDKLLGVKLYQPFCDDEEITLGPPTTDFNSASAIALSHHQQTGDVTDVIVSQ